MQKIGANDQCPCWSGKKFKKCCRGSVNWPAIIESGGSHIHHLSVRGRNLMFAVEIYDALKLENEKIPDLATFKKSFTTDAVRKIHEAVFELWPPDTDLQYVLRKGSSTVSGLYIGDYESEFLERSVVRHCLYADKILLVDPFPHPHIMAPEFDPRNNPTLYRAQTLKNVNRFLRFLPWIDAGLVEFIRTPSDLDRDLNWESLKQARKIAAEPDLKIALEATVEEMTRRHTDHQAKHYLLMGAPDSYLRDLFKKRFANQTKISESQFISYVQKQRDADPDFLEPLDSSSSQLHIHSTGGTVEIAKATAEIAGAYLFTDIKFRWRLLQKDRESLTAKSNIWSPFAKAIQDANLSFLNNIDLPIALDLRSEGKLEGIRRVLHNAWKADLSDEEYDEKNTILFAENLVDSIREAEAEWTNIRANFAKTRTAGIAGGLLAAGPLIASGNAIWIAGAAVTATAGHTLATMLEHRGFKKRFPASFFINMQENG